LTQEHLVVKSLNPLTRWSAWSIILLEIQQIGFSCPLAGKFRKGVHCMEWITPDFEEYELEAEVTAYAAHW